MNEITVTLSFSNSHTIYKKKGQNISKFPINFKKFQNFKLFNKFQNFKSFIKFLNFKESYVIKQLLHLNEIHMRFYGAEYNNIEQAIITFKQYERTTAT